MIPLPRITRVLLATLLGLTLISCASTTTVRSVKTAPLMTGDADIPESQLLDVGVRLFDPNAKDIEEDDLFTSAEIRQAEARYMPSVLVKTLGRSGHWGAVRLVPDGTSITDVTVDGRILSSTGEELVLEITPSDSTGAVWYTRRYEGHANRYSYDDAQSSEDPFADVYNRIANDLAIYRAGISEQKTARIRRTTELRFAESFQPGVYGGHLSKNADGRYEIVRLPADNDPMMTRIRRIRERDHMFIDTLQDYYDGFNRTMSGPYRDWRRDSYNEILEYQQLKRQGTARTVAGIASVLGGLIATQSDSPYTRAAGTVGIMGGAAMIKSGISKRADAKMHAETLRELGGSLGAEITPQVLELDDKSVTLTGTVQDQYTQWRQILHGIYEAETGNI